MFNTMSCTVKCVCVCERVCVLVSMCMCVATDMSVRSCAFAQSTVCAILCKRVQ